MSSIRCPKCNLTNWVQAVACKRCGFEFSAAAQAYAPQAGAAPRSQFPEPGFVEVGRQSPPRYGYHTAINSAALKTGLAMVSMVLGIVCIPTVFILVGILLAPIALILGIVALVQASRKPFVYGGKGFAIAGIATSSVAMFLMIPIIAAIAIPNLLAAKRAADEGSAISCLRKLHAAEATYAATAGAGYYADISSLSKASLVESELATGKKNGYEFEAKVVNAGRGFEIYATPLSKSGGGRSFIVTEEGVIRGSQKKGIKAEKTDPPLAN